MICETCRQTVTLARSVKLRRWWQEHPALAELQKLGIMIDDGERKTLKADMTPAEQDALARLNGQYERDMQYRRAFICCGCYATLDSRFGVGEIDGRKFGLSGDCRQGKAATYTEDAFKRYQKRMAARMGIDL